MKTTRSCWRAALRLPFRKSPAAIPAEPNFPPLAARALLAAAVFLPFSPQAPGPLTVEVHRESAGGAPIAGAVVHVGGRLAVTGKEGAAVFDGIPSGDYELRVEGHGFDRHAARLTLASGARETVQVVLRPSEIVPLEGVVRTPEGWPIAGARIELAASATRAGYGAHNVLHSGWDGKFELLEVPVGKYELRVSAGGCEPQTRQIEIGPGPDPLEVELAPKRSEAGFQVVVRDSVSGEPVPGAEVTLAEAWPLAVLADSTSGEDGRATFAGLRLAQRNWKTADGTFPASGGHATVHVAAEGHEEITVPIPQRLGGSLELELHPDTPIEEQEPNNDIASATAIRTGCPVHFTIPENGDHDLFRFHLDDPARVRVALDAGIPLWIRFQLLSADGKVLAETTANKGDAPAIEADLGRGEFTVLVHQFYDNHASDDPFTLKVERKVAADPFEPNDSPSTARMLRNGEEVRGFVFPMGDHDCYRFEMARPGHVRLSMPPVDLWRVAELRDASGKVISSAVANKNAPLELTQQVAAGEFLVTVRQYYDDTTCLDPYTLRLETIEDDAVDDPAEVPGTPLRAVRSLEIGETAGSTIFPNGDVDRWSLALPEPGVLHAHLAAPFWGRLRLRSLEGEQLAEGVANAGSTCELSWACPEPRGVLLEIRQYYDNADSNLPYVLTTWWDPADETDLLARNETLEDAFPALLGEPLRGSIQPAGDRDFYRLKAGRPGVLKLEGTAPFWLHLFLHDAQGRVLADVVSNRDQPFSLDAPVLSGEYFVELREFYDDRASVLPYVVRTRLDRVAPMEAIPLAEDPVRKINLGEIVPVAIEQNGDHDRFRFRIRKKGPFFLRMRPTVWTHWSLLDEDRGKEVSSGDLNANQERSWQLAAEGPMRCRLEIKEYYDDVSSLEPGFFVVDRKDRPLAGGRLEVQVDPADPTLAHFQLTRIEGLALPSQARLDADGDGTADANLPPGGSVAWRYAKPGLYAARVKFTAADGTPGTTWGWANAVGTRPRKGVQIVVSRPAEGATMERSDPCRVRAISYSGAGIRRIEFALDGRPAATAMAAPFEAKLPWATLGGGEHTLTVTAVDGRGERGVVERHFRVSEYFDLLPENGAVITGDDVTVSWTGPQSGRAAVRWRVQGEKEWRTTEGERARWRRIVLRDLEAGKTCEIQPLGGSRPGPVRTVTRVLGLAFGKDRYAARIERDYDQRIGVSVRNHSDKAQRVRLACGAPPAESRLLAGFLGEGSDENPVELGPGEEREFLLALSAQDVDVPQVRFPIRIASDAGYSDEAEVAADVHLPVVKLRWEAVPDESDELHRHFILHNDGDGLTDLQLHSDSPDMLVSPELDHAVFPPGGALHVVARPRLYEGFQEVESALRAGAVGVEAAQEEAIRLPEGQSVYGVQLVGGVGVVGGEASRDQLALAARTMAGAYLNPGAVDWSRRTNPVDTDGDGRVDRWSIDDVSEGILWVGDDTEGDGEIDFVHADIGSDGQYDFSAYRTGDGWQETNLVEAYLEVGFGLPQPREDYHKHDLDLLMNEVLVASLRDVIPEGNYTFRLPPHSIRFNEEGLPEGNHVQIKSRHLNGGHYAVTSDFRIKVRMTGTRVWTVAGSEEEAGRKVLDTEGLAVKGPDYSISSSELRMTGQPVRGKELVFTAPVRNVGATRTRTVPAALMKDAGDGTMIELARTYLEDVPLTGSAALRLSWMAIAGAHTLWVVLDPDHETGDTNDANDRAAISCVVAGDEAPPTLNILEPKDQAELDDTIAPVVVEASDDNAILRVEVSVDGGLPGPLDPLPEAGRYAGRVLLQPGPHTITATAVDGSNRRTSASAGVSVAAHLPNVEITRPEPGAKLDVRKVEVHLRADRDAKVVAGRVNGGPWHAGTLADGEGSIPLDLSFGPAALEVMATSPRGARATAVVHVECTAQPEEKKKDERKDENPPAEPKTTVDVDGVGPMDALGPPNGPLAPTGGTSAGRHPATGPAGPSGGPGPATVNPSDRRRVGAAPATNLQPKTLPPHRELPPPVEEKPAPDKKAPEPPAPEEKPRPAGGDLGPGEVRGGPPLPAPQALRPPPSRAVGGFIGANARKKDWYCTNRPEIEVPFPLPDWLKNKKLPKPGTKEFDAMVRHLLTDMQMRGIRTGKLEQFQKALLDRIRGMDQPGGLPGLLESFGSFGPRPDDPKALAEWRKKMENSAQAWFLRLLASGDPEVVAKGLKARADAIGQFDKAMLDNAKGALTEIEGNQKLVEEVANTLPIVGEMSDLYAFATGENALSGTRVGALERVIRIVGVIGPLGLEQLVKRSPNARLLLQGFGEMGQSAGKKGRQMLAAVLRLPPGKVDDAFMAVGRFLTKERRLLGETLEDKMAREARLFAKSPEGIADATRQLRDHAEARDLVNRLRNAAPDSDDFHRAVRELQSNKTAQALINRADVPNDLRNEVNRHIGTWYQGTDEGVAEGFEGLYRNGRPNPEETARLAHEMGITPQQAEEFQQQVEAFARKHGVDPSDVEVGTLTITNRRPPRPGEPPRVSVGRDRDVTFQIQATVLDPATGRPRMIAEDIDHTLTKNPYDRNFYTASGEGELPTLPDGSVDQARVSRYAEDTMDQTVTSASHVEAYNTGPVQLDDFLDKGITPTLTRVDDVCDTVAYKSNHWFHKADEMLEGTSDAARGLSETERKIMASRHTAEGMRQATKQYDDLVLSRVRQYGLDPKVHVPPRLQESMEIFRQVKDGVVSPAKAEAMLKAIGTSKEGAVRELSGFLNGLEKTAGVGWRRVKAAELVNHLSSLEKAGGSGWQDEALEAVNNALRNGEVSGTQFLKLRRDVTEKTIQALKTSHPDQWKSLLQQWADQAFQRRIINAVERVALKERTK